jgi:hypothetical protein
MKTEPSLTRKSWKTNNLSNTFRKAPKTDEKHLPNLLKIYVDEGVSIAITEGLKRRGVTAFSAKGLGKLGLTDEEQLETARKNQAVIFTHDADFIRIATNKKHLGIIYVHQQKMT